jgi:tetratricopeptide (TPR) repeat protein
VDPENPYLKGVRILRPSTRWVRAVALLVLTGVLFYALSRLLDPGDGVPLDPATYVVVLFVLTAVAGFVVLRRRRSGVGVADVRVLAEALVLRDDFDAAVPKLKDAIRTSRGPWRQANLLALLGRCAEGRGDFAHAADVYARAEGLLPSRRTVAYAQLAPILAARAAFALAASGRLDEATNALARAGGRDAYPGTRALAARALALVLTRRGEHEALRKHVDEARVVVKNSLSYRDRALMRVVAANAQRALTGHLRGGVPAGLHLDAETRSWIARAAPEVVPFLEEVA